MEDSNSGYEFFSVICDENQIVCISAGGKSNLKTVVRKLGNKPTLVIADGAAIGILSQIQ
nr:hypothetical protein [uncultured Acetatifactor sp.]